MDVNKRIIRVFIYGSLLPGQHNRHVVDSFVLHAEEGRIAGRLVDFGPYPALVRDTAAKQTAAFVTGQWITVDRNGLAAMDELEEFIGYEENNDYDRIWVRDLDNPGLSGWVYVWPDDRGFPPIAATFWPDFYAAKISRQSLA
ncbi:gamma-glutamylcyclotransferase family protein [Paenibacillus sp. MMS18-CY102]|uniref:gamma-glutamylcyclotransferase family protein n=1 Tax=Paenibacillus sp. MMS18-CY102 TaxID=2682849 RepID=UPI001366610C|nr:gamma-glutamylcyclotransferase family protein [Paenibacillus sp. MMS18-CY102]MWC29018.1 gamma-glutamylcyclotransferase [Paenibacillus sp. MMS18-CY102]